MELMSPMPTASVLKSPRTSVSTDSEKSADDQGGEIVSFPSLLQETQKPIKAGNSLKVEGSVSQPLASEQVAVQAAVQAAPDSNSQPLDPSGLLSGAVVENSGETSAETVSPEKPQTVPTLPTELVAPTQAEPVAVADGAQVLTIPTAPVAEAKEIAGTQDGPATDSPKLPPSVALAPEEESLLQKVPQETPELKAPIKTQAPAQGLPAAAAKPEGAEGPIPENLKPILETKVETPELGAKLKEDSAGQETAREKVEVKPSPAEPSNTDATKDNTSENPLKNSFFQRPPSAELDQLSVQANAQKSYQQPAPPVEQGSAHKPTLSDLGLESVSAESPEKMGPDGTRILSSTHSPSTPLLKNIRSQVTQKVMENLKNEIGQEKLTIRLNPEKLGQVEILFQAQGDNLNIVMNAGGSEAEKALQEGVRELSESIADKSPRWNVVEIRVENRGQEQTKQDPRNDERREKQGQNEKQQDHKRRNQGNNPQNLGAGEWADFHLGG
jgi:flagellar hook-length control protein FliK